MATKDDLPRSNRWLGIVLGEVLALFLVAVIAAFAYDGLWLGWRGKPRWMVCALFDLLPWAALPGIGWVLILIGFGFGMTRQRAFGVALLALGALMAGAPELFIPDWLMTRCPDLGSEQELFAIIR